MAAVRFTFSMDAIQHAAYIRRLELEPNKSAVILAAIIAYYDRPTLAQVDAKLDQVLDALRGVQVVQAGAAASEASDAEPARARANLDKMKQRFRK